MIFNMVGGSGSGKSFAVIHVEYPAGGTCICYMGEKMLAAKDASGAWNFAVPSSGSWKIKYQNGSTSKELIVNVTSQNEILSVEIGDTITLYNAGVFGDVEYDTLLGSVTGASANNVTFDATSIGARGDSDGKTDQYAYVLFGPVSLAGASTITATMRKTDSINGTTKLHVYIADDKTTTPFNAEISAEELSSTRNNDYNVSLDVSALSNDVYVYVGTYVPASWTKGNDRSVSISKVVIS